jgi:hypothetical protein
MEHLGKVPNCWFLCSPLSIIEQARCDPLDEWTSSNSDTGVLTSSIVICHLHFAHLTLVEEGASILLGSRKDHCKRDTAKENAFELDQVIQGLRQGLWDLERVSRRLVERLVVWRRAHSS